jgi:hypothetical protein
MTRSWFLQVWGTNASPVCVLEQSLQRWARWALNVQFKDDLKIRDDGSNGCELAMTHWPGKQYARSKILMDP